jgi:hypothetical protein
MTAFLTRRRLLAGSAAAAALGSGLVLVPDARASTGSPVDRAVDRAYGYLDTVMDAYATGPTTRLLQSYNNESGLLTTGFVYDNALAVIAYLACPTAAHVARATVLGDSLLWVQAHDETFTDGRVRQGYATGPMVFYGGGPTFPGVVREDGRAAFLWPFGFGGSATGDVAWTGLALTHLFAHTRQRRYLDGALALGTWIATNTVSPFHFGGYHGGVQGDGVTRQRWCSTEHNIDVYGFFRLLATLTREPAWRTRAEVARSFVTAMWHPAGGFFYTGTQGAGASEDPNLVNTAILPEDVNTWSYLSLRDRRFARSIDWAATNLATTDVGGVSANSQLPAGYTVSGVTFSDQSRVLTGPVPNGTGANDRSAVWFEGTAHLAAALSARDDRHDRTRAQGYLAQIVSAQGALGAGQTVGLTTGPGGRLDPAVTVTGHPLPARSGVVAASSAFDTGFGFGYFQNQHVGATSWFLLAALLANPYRV